ncbi:uncharacterized protein LOC112590372 [Harpegnathos saltator]|uniref:uncharacterized protein LOC112590372 n=1 Tax=Harpegnathos saltator TaxID=610380 RepID=UPI000DBEED30|nr:uncharacterized protein LOC112590372 [Harpegnathos saltator]
MRSPPSTRCDDENMDLDASGAALPTGDPPYHASAVRPSSLTTESVVSVQNCRWPPFWKSNPELWFLQVEAVFQALRVRTDETKYSLAVSLLDPYTLQELSDVIRSPPSDGKYDHLKATILSRFSDSTDRQLLRLLTQLELGDRKPSQLLRQMRTLAGSRVSDDVVRVKWLDLLPVGMQRILKVLKSHDLEELAAAADELLGSGPGFSITETHASPNVCASCSSPRTPQSPPQPDVAAELSAIRQALAQLTSSQHDVLLRLDTMISHEASRSSSRGRPEAARSVAVRRTAARVVLPPPSLGN